MPIRTYTDIFCDECGDWEHTGEHASKRRARAAVFGLGWRTVKRDGQLIELCPRCAKVQAQGRQAS